MTLRRPISCGSIPAWLRARCELGQALFEHAGALYDDWRGFAHARGDEPGSPSEFAGEMERRGFAVDRIPPIERRRVRWGLRLR